MPCLLGCLKEVHAYLNPGLHSQTKEHTSAKGVLYLANLSYPKKPCTFMFVGLDSISAGRAALSAAVRQGPGWSVSHSEVAYTHSSSSTACSTRNPPASTRASCTPQGLGV